MIPEVVLNVLSTGMGWLGSANKDLKPAQNTGCNPSLTTFITTWLYPEIKEKKQRPATPKVSRFRDSIFNILN